MSGGGGLRKHGHSSTGDGGALTTGAVPTHATTHKTGGTDSIKLNELAVPTADVSLNSHKLTNVTDPGSAQDAATKAYVDATVAGAGGLSDHGVITYLDATVAAAPADPSAGQLRIYAKTGGHLAQRDSAGVETLLDASGGLLAVVMDAAAGNVVSSSTTLADIDATNFAVTFTAPASGKVVVRMSGIAQLTTDTGKFYKWGLREGSTTVGGPTTVCESFGAAFYSHYNVDFLISGLTPGNSYTYKGAHQRSSGGTFAIIGGTGEERYLTVTAA